jgi:glycosyltransferase involved in cell wall biosynthesis
MPVFNSKKYLREAIESVLNQSYKDFEFIIINELGSNDGSDEIIKKYIKNDSRIILVQNEKKLGLAESLNLGIKLAKGEYIARMDADDIALPNRFLTQIKFLDEHKEIDVCATDVKFIDENGVTLNLRDDFPNNHEQICTDLLFSTCIRHPTVMMRRASLKNAELYYNPDYYASEDYEFWSRACHVLRFARLRDALLLYRWHSSNATITNGEKGIDCFLNVMANNFQRLGMHFSQRELRILCALTCEMNLGNFIKTCRFISGAAQKLYKSNDALRLYEPNCLKKTMQKRMFWRKKPHRLLISVTLRSVSLIKARITKKPSGLLKTTSTYVEIHGLRKTISRMMDKITK